MRAQGIDECMINVHYYCSSSSSSVAVLITILACLQWKLEM